MEESEIASCGFLDRKDTGTIRRFTRKNPGVDRAAVAQDKVCDTVYTFELSHAIDADPFVFAEEMGGAYPVHEGPVADAK